MKKSVAQHPASKSKLRLTFILVAAAAAVVVSTKFYIDSNRSGIGQGAQARMKGNPKAKVHIIEFADFQCPACAQGSVYSKKIMTDHPDLIYLEMKYYPLAMHRHGAISAQYAECAARQGQFWPFQDKLFEQQKVWEIFIDPRPAFELIAKDLKMDVGNLQACGKDEKILAVIEKDKTQGKNLGVNSTPTYFVNEKMLVGVKSLSEELEKYLHETK